MSRRHILFDCEGARLAGTLDAAGGKTGLLIVTGGNEVRSGAFAGQAELAAQVARAGFPVFRFDRRGVGDSEGENNGFRESRADITAAIAAFREHAPTLERVIGFGNCDAASALMLCQGAGCDALILSNPWTFDEAEGDANDHATPDTASARAHYARRLRDPAAMKRLLTGSVSPGKLLRGIAAALRPSPPPSSLVEEMQAGLRGYGGDVRYLVAGNDRTGNAFMATRARNDPQVRLCPDASHAYVEQASREWLLAQVLEVLRG